MKRDGRDAEHLACRVTKARNTRDIIVYKLTIWTGVKRQSLFVAFRHYSYSVRDAIRRKKQEKKKIVKKEELWPGNEWKKE